MIPVLMVATFKKPWARRFNPPRIRDVVRETDTVRANGVSIYAIAEFIAVMEPNQHLEIMRDQQMLLPAVEDFSIREMPAAYFMRDGETINLKFMTKEELLRDGNPQEMLYEALRKYSASEYRSVRGYSWLPYMGGVRFVVPTVHQKLGWDIAAALWNDVIEVKILNPRGKSVIYIPSRRTDEEYVVRFHNLPTGKDAYADWTLTSHETGSVQSVFAGMSEQSKLEQTVFGEHQIAAYLLRGMADPLAAADRTGKDWQVLEDLVVLPFSPPSNEMLSFFRNLGRVYSLHVNGMHQRRERLNLAEQQVLLSAWMHQTGPDSVFDYSPQGRFDKGFVRAAFERILK